MSKKLNVKYFIQDTSSNWASENPKMSEGVIAYETDTNKIKLFDGEHSFSELSYVGGEGSSGGATDYSALTGKPRINSVELSGNKSLDDLGIQAKGEYATKAQGAKADTAVQPSALSAYATTEAMNSALANKADTSALSGKANKSTTLNGYGITDAYTKTEADGKYATKAQGTKADTAVQPATLDDYLTTANATSTYLSKTAASSTYATKSELADKADTSALSAYVTTETASSTYATKASLSGYATTSALEAKADKTALNGKADKETTLAGYGITDAYTKTETDGKYATKAQGSKADTAVQPSALSAYVTTETATSTYATKSELADKADTSALDDYLTTANATSTYATKASLSGYATTSALDGKANKSTTLNGYGITDAYTKTEADGKYALKTAIPSGDKIMTGTKASATVSKPAGEEVAQVKTSLEALIDALSARGIITIA